MDILITSHILTKAGTALERAGLMRGHTKVNGGFVMYLYCVILFFILRKKRGSMKVNQDDFH
ncbi:hypothetical protein AM592_06160 [Bacillus gobiensis]|uniref:Uncharacterized protein n=2 Tax=Bacillus TaxID=1386 RepID=A0A0M4FFQ9_9BACI|nr:hypothetical protein [Bacillus capparidis]ALC81224.1 hypothetical protein AM592_06160 [Bacillus gobiensis]MBP1080213.1 hypothetical protein [Bacillus capparidis]MED1094085.1 hypothetical protein [Bacillus capparidis]